MDIWTVPLELQTEWRVQGTVTVNVPRCAQGRRIWGRRWNTGPIIINHLNKLAVKVYNKRQAFSSQLLIHIVPTSLSVSLQVWFCWSGGPIRNQHYNLGSLVWAEGTSQSQLQSQHAQSHLQFRWLFCCKTRIQNLLLNAGEPHTFWWYVICFTRFLHAGNQSKSIS